MKIFVRSNNKENAGHILIEDLKGDGYSAELS